jgi:hypothetical protein
MSEGAVVGFFRGDGDGEVELALWNTRVREGIQGHAFSGRVMELVDAGLAANTECPVQSSR